MLKNQMAFEKNIKITHKSYCIVLYCIVLYCIVLYCIKKNGQLFPILAHFFPQNIKKIILHCIVLYCIVLYCIQKKRPNFATFPNFRPFFPTNRPKNHIALYCIVLYCIVSKKNGQISQLFLISALFFPPIVQKNHIASTKTKKN